MKNSTCRTCLSIPFVKRYTKMSKKIFDKHYKIIINEKYCKEELHELSDE